LFGSQTAIETWHSRVFQTRQRSLSFFGSHLSTRGGTNSPEQPSLGRAVPSHFIRVRPAVRLPAQANQGPFLASGTGKPGCCCMPRLKNKFLPSPMQKVRSAAAVLQHLPPFTARLPKPSPPVHVTQYFSASWPRGLTPTTSPLNGLKGPAHGLVPCRDR
jgi:hypothetical protein